MAISAIVCLIFKMFSVFHFFPLRIPSILVHHEVHNRAPELVGSVNWPSQRVDSKGQSSE
jgi:hypothetical protein